MNKDISQRLNLLLKEKNLSASKLAQIIGIQKSSISHIMSGRNKPSFDFLLKLKEHFPDINLDWFITGEGEMYETTEQPQIAESKQTKLFDNSEQNKNGSSFLHYETKKTVHKSKRNDVDSIIMVYDDDTYKILKPRE
jgi:transcriptional regulator with XRE-family HTH domain